MMDNRKLHSKSYARRPIDTLQKMALDAVLKIVEKWQYDLHPCYNDKDFHTCRSKRGREFRRTLRSYIPPPIIQLLADMPANEISDPDFSIYHESLKRLRLNLNEDTTLEDVFYRSDGPSRAVSLHLRDSSYLRLSHFPSLRSVKFELRASEYDCQNFPQMLSEMGAGCPNLEEFLVPQQTFPWEYISDKKEMPVHLDHAWKFCFSDWDSERRVPNPCCWTLKTLILPNILGVSTIAVLLQNLSALVTFAGGCDVMGALNSALKPRKITSDGQVTKTKEITIRRISGIGTSGKQLDMLATLCPNLNHISLLNMHSSASVKISLLKNLSHLVLLGTKWKMLSPILGKVGHNLKVLQLSDMEGMLDLSRLCKTCPKLETLLLYHIRKKILTKPLSFPHLQRLVTFDIIDDGVLYPILESAPRLQELYWKHTSTLGDTEMANILHGNGLKEIETFCISEAPGLGLQTFDLLMLNCPNLRTVGEMDSWNLTDTYKLFSKAEKERWKICMESYAQVFYTAEQFIPYQ